MAIESNASYEEVSAVKQEIEEAWVAGDTSSISEFYAEQIKLHDPASPIDVGTVDDYETYLTEYIGGQVGQDVTFDHVANRDDTVAVAVSFSDATGDEATVIRGTQVFRFSGGTVVERWGSLLQESEVEQFASDLRGNLVVPMDGDYNETRAVWNGMIDKYPGMIATSTGVTDVITCVNFAREHELLISIRGGGHNVAAKGVCNGGLMIDCSGLTGVQLNLKEQTATVQPGVTWGLLDHEAQEHGLATPGGVVSTTGVAGLTLGGGYGWISRKFGLSCDRLVEAQVVTAQGEVVRAAEDQNEDLLWALRGGGGNFGIVTQFTFDLVELGPDVYAGVVFHALEDAKEALQFYREWAADAPKEATCYPIFRMGPDFGFMPEEHRGEVVFGFGLMYAGDPAKGKEVFEPVEEFGDPVADLMRVRKFKNWQSWSDQNWPKGNRNYWKSNYLAGLDDDTIDTLIDHAADLSSPLTEILVAQLGGAINEVDQNATAYPHRDAPYLFAVDSQWTDSEEDERHLEYTREFYEAMQPHYTDGVYVNYLTEEGQERVESAYRENYERLAEIKADFDPDNLFRLNQNIQPTE